MELILEICKAVLPLECHRLGRFESLRVLDVVVGRLEIQFIQEEIAFLLGPCSKGFIQTAKVSEHEKCSIDSHL